MALNRRDTPLANTPDPGKGNVTRTQVTNPNGSTTYKMNWNNAGSSSSSKPVARNTSARVSSTPIAKSSSSGSREITTIIPMDSDVEKTKMGGSLDLSRLTSRIETPSIEKRREEMRVKTYDKWKQEGESRSDYDARIKAATEKNAAKNRDKSRDLSGGSGKGPSGSGGCHSC